MRLQNVFSWKRKLRPDVSEVVEVAAMLDTTEFDIFRKAYANWFGERADDDKIEGFFVEYMFTDQVPLWVRHFTRPLLSTGHQDGDGALNDHRPRRPPTSQSSKMMAGISTVLVVLALALLVALAMNAAELTRVFDSCYFPPCY